MSIQSQPTAAQPLKRKSGHGKAIFSLIFSGAVLVMIAMSVSSNMQAIEQAEKELAAAWAQCIYFASDSQCTESAPSGEEMYQKHKAYADQWLQENIFLYGE